MIIKQFTFATILQKIVATILFIAFFGQTFSQAIFYVDYLVDKAAYAKNCINKKRPQLHCNGKCQLMKKLEEQERKDQQKAPEMKFAAKVEVLSSKSWYATITHCSLITVRSQYSHYPVSATVDQPSSIFHPPGA